MTKVAAKEWALRLRVNSIHQASSNGYDADVPQVATRKRRSTGSARPGRIGTPQDIATLRCSGGDESLLQGPEFVATDAPRLTRGASTLNARSAGRLRSADLERDTRCDGDRKSRTDSALLGGGEAYQFVTVRT